MSTMVQVPSFPYMSTTLFGNNSSKWKLETNSAEIFDYEVILKASEEIV